MWTIIFTHFIQKSVLISEKITGAHPIWMELLTNLDVVNHWINLLHFSGTISKIKIGLYLVGKVTWKVTKLESYLSNYDWISQLPLNLSTVRVTFKLQTTFPTSKDLAILVENFPTSIELSWFCSNFLCSFWSILFLTF